MKQTVYGVYNETVEVIQAINSLKAKGYDGADITIFADKEDKMGLLDNYTLDKDVKTVSNNEDSFMDKIVKFFTLDTNNPVEETLRTDYGFTSEESARYAEDVNNGKVLVLVKQTANVESPVGMDRTEDVSVGANASSARNTTDRTLFEDSSTKRMDRSSEQDSMFSDEETLQSDKNRLYQKNRIDTDNL